MLCGAMLLLQLVQTTVGQQLFESTECSDLPWYDGLEAGRLNWGACVLPTLVCWHCNMVFGYIHPQSLPETGTPVLA